MSKVCGNGPGMPVMEPTTPDPEQSAVMFIEDVCGAMAVAVLVGV
jgi:hypothetical protein